ncbi:MAG: alanine dehydrogenase [Deltaproteobacteria bacterium]|nr:alanine dehydrogenase [Deltaproteobacteria bacterium]MBW2140652.1 alanine dehydrogenase [Deltaproteobacteria bacterium]
MIIGVPKEIKNSEFRVGMVPSGVRVLTDAGHQVLVQESGGLGSGLTDGEYVRAGAVLLSTALEVYTRAEMIVKVKEPQPEEYPLLRENQILFTYLHLAPAPELTQSLIDSRCIGVAYETIQLEDGSLPLLMPMSEVAGRLAPQIGAHYLENVYGGCGVLLSGVPGVQRGKVTIVGGGVVGTNAAKIAVGLGAEVYILDINHQRMAALDDLFGNTVNTVMATHENIASLVSMSYLVIGAVLIPGAKAPALVTREMVSNMLSGSVIVDVAIDQGGCVETSRPTSHQDPVFVVDGVIHYCVANIPGMVARTSTFALNNVTLPYALEIANKGIERAVKENRALARGINLYKGNITCPGVAEPMQCDSEEILKLVS